MKLLDGKNNDLKNFIQLLNGNCSIIQVMHNWFKLVVLVLELNLRFPHLKIKKKNKQKTENNNYTGHPKTKPGDLWHLGCGT